MKACDEGDTYRKYGDLITANLYRLPKKADFVELEDWEAMDDEGNCPKLRIELDSRMSVSANAQRFYKKYAKSKTAKVELAKQIEIGESELEYIYTVFESLTRAESPADLSEIRDELFRSRYASRMKNYASHKPKAPVVMQFETPDGMRVLCGKNNIQNEYITHRLAEKQDYWFHAKQSHGSHVLLVTEGREPTDLDFTTAAEISRTKMEIKRTERELVNLRNLIAERTSWSYVRSQIIRYGIKLHRPEPGQTHRVERLSDSAVKLAAANMRAKALERAVALAASAPAPAAETVKAVKPVQTVRTVQVVKRVKPAPVVKRRSVTSARRRVASGRRDLQRYEFR